MPVKELQKPVKINTIKTEKIIGNFISRGGGLAENLDEKKDDHRLTLRMPKWLLERIDLKRKERVGGISRNLWILEVIEKASRA